MVSKDDHGLIVLDNNKEQVFFPLCEGGETNPCDDPEMLLTVTGTTGTINWCGETWNLPGDSGVQKSVCPTVYALYKYTLNYAGSSYGSPWSSNLIDCKHIWSFNFDSLRLERQYGRRDDLLNSKMYKTFGQQIASSVDLNKAPSGSDQDFIAFTPTQFGTPFPPPMNLSGWSSFPLGVLTTGAAPPRENDYKIHNGMFGSTTISGITYTWEKGLGWP